MKTLSLSHFLGTLSLCVMLAACGDSGSQGSGAPDAAAQQAMMAPKVTVAKPLIGPVTDSDAFTGRFEATDTVEIRARVNGYLRSIDFTDGAYVEKDAQLFVIDPRPFEAVVTQRRADLRAAESRIQLAKNTFERTRTLFESGDISAQIRDQRQSELVQAQAAVEQAKAALAAAQLDLSYTTIKAPIAGRISRQLVSEGNLVNAGQDVLTTIVSTDPIHFYFDIDEQTYLKYVRQGDSDAGAFTARIALSDEQDYVHEARIDFIDNTIASNTGTMRGRAVVANTNNLITPGMFGRVKISGAQSYQAVQVPDSAIGTDQSRKFVMVVDAEGTVAPRPVELGAVNNGMRVIKSGLDGSELVVINGLQRAQPGAKVTPEVTDLSAQQQQAPAPEMQPQMQPETQAE